MCQNHVAFLHEEFLKLPSFPRKALETEFDMYSGEWGKVRRSFGLSSSPPHRHLLKFNLFESVYLFALK